jgi:hypothetical protein
MEPTRTGRPCTICTSPHRADIETALVEGDSLTSVSRHFENVQTDALRRHLAKHVSPQVLEAMRTVEGLTPSTIATRLQDIADAARDARHLAAQRGNVTGALRAGDAEGRALTVLADRFGVTADSVARDLETGWDLAQAIVHVSAQSPDVGLQLADTLESLGNRVFADQLRNKLSTNKGIQP